MKNKIDKLITHFLVAIILIGIGFLAYPSISDYWNSFHQSRAIMNYQENVSNMDTSEYKRLLESASVYNEQFLDAGILWKMTDQQKERYHNELSVDETGNMGFLTIPKIKVTLPIYHGTSEDVLQTSIGHLEGTSLPVGGDSTHSVLSGHRGLPSARLFSDLDKLKEGDRWTVNILNETYTYEVDQIRIVEPKDLSNIQIEEGKDYQTLLTCTPYGVNTHRLLVRGHRVANENGEALVLADAIQIEPIYIMPFIAIPVLGILLIVFINKTNQDYKRKQVLKQYKRKD
ncbi:class C sortase [Streptococcus moroccensis]|uniref:Sortase A n=1 Tax=Streptococcus moroccensis TaxID=1451356 RepID=A0ABT9YTU9_9STRE|nr:class C sortase [Streptococcus moroccensis]MDQ0223426.1 sortase A [Streptococcus moroccensis]